jgi:RNA polymerase sigma-54 factor
MPMHVSLGQRLEQRLKMTAQMIQSIEMLQLPLMALEQQINVQLAENPVLELEEEDRENELADAERAEREELDDFAKLEEMSRDEEWEDALSSSAPIRTRSDEEDPKLSAMANTASRPQTLQEHLVEQIRLSEAPDRTREVAEVLAFDLDDNGYMLVPPEEVFAGSEEPPAPVTPEEAADALKLIQSLDPAGVGAQSVEECLLLQLAREPDAEKLDFENRLISEHFDDLLNNRLPKVASEMGVDIERIKKAIERISHLNPRPGRDFATASTQYVVPDVIVDEVDGEYQVRMNDTLPRIRISSLYREMLKKEKRGSAARDYLRERLQSAKWLIDSIAQRRSTLDRIANEIVKEQRDFFEHGVSHLRPLMMQDVAATIGMHVSTVSRAIAEKYMDTPQGLIPMRYFFTSGYRSNAPDADAVSNKTVMNQIAEMVKAEEKKKPLSDAEIAKRLRADGIDIARRTVAKYREKLEIPGSRQRKQY